MSNVVSRCSASTRRRLPRLNRSNRQARSQRCCSTVQDFQTVRDVPRPAVIPPLVGDSLPYLRNWEDYFDRRVAEVGPVFRTNVLGEDVIMVCDAKIGKEMAEKFDVSSMVPVSAESLKKAFIWDGKTAGNTRLDQFASLGSLQAFKDFKRKTFIEAFGPPHMPSAYPTIEGIFRSLLEEAAARDGPVNITDIMQDATLQVVYARTVGRNTQGDETQPMARAIEDFCSHLAWLFLPDALNPRFRDFKAAHARLRDACLDLVADVRPQFEAVQRGEQAPPPPERTSCFIWNLLEHEAQSAEALTSEDWACNLTSAYLAGHETTRWAATLMLLNLDQNPALVEELKVELAAAQAELGEQVWTSRAAAARLPLCEAVIAETTRLMLGDGRYGVSLISLMRRVARKDFECAGFRIKHGEAVLFAMPPMMQAMSSFAAPDGGFDRRFDPHRFIKGTKLVKPDAFEPFGFGPRRCPGEALAVTEMRALLKLVACDGLRVKFEDPDSAWGPRGITASIKNGSVSVSFAK